MDSCDITRTNKSVSITKPQRKTNGNYYFNNKKKKKTIKKNYPQPSQRDANSPDRKRQPFLHSTDEGNDAPHCSFMHIFDSIFSQLLLHIIPNYKQALKKKKTKHSQLK